MVTPEQLAELLRGVNVAEVAKAANVSTKTVYRIRQGGAQPKHMPNLATVHRLLEAIQRLKPPVSRKARKVAA